MAYHGVQGRGVLVDLAHHLGHEFRGVDRATLEEIMAADNVVVEPGDMLLLHTGFATKVLEWNREPDPVEIHPMCTYLDAHDESLLEWIADSQISALVADNYAVEGLVGGPRREGRHSLLPIHHLCLFKLGVPLGEMWYLHELATWLREHNRSRFLLTAPPLRLPGVVGSPAHADRHRLTPSAVTRPGPAPSAFEQVRRDARVGRGTRRPLARRRVVLGIGRGRIGAVIEQRLHRRRARPASAATWSGVRPVVVTGCTALDQSDDEVPAAVRGAPVSTSSAGGRVRIELREHRRVAPGHAIDQRIVDDR